MTQAPLIIPEAALTPLARSISEVLAGRSRVPVASIVAATGTRRNTVNATTTRLLRAGLPVRQGSDLSIHHTKR